MRRTPLAVLLAAGVTLVAAGARLSSQPPVPQKAGVFSALRVGQAVSLKDKGGLFEVGTVDGADPLTHKVVEVGETHIVVRDGSGQIDTAIPVTSVRAVVHVRLGGK